MLKRGRLAWTIELTAEKRMLQKGLTVETWGNLSLRDFAEHRYGQDK